MIVSFWLFVVLCMYSYFIYPLILILMWRERVSFDRRSESDDLPRLSLIIAVHNEEARIAEKIEDTLRIDYPQELLEIIVASDYSTDRTDEIVRSYRGRGIRLIRANQRRGKEYAQLCAIRESASEILVFSDVATSISSDSLRSLARIFRDPQIGAVSSEDRFISAGGRVVGESAYVRYEMWLRRLESARGGIVGLSGSFFAARREVCVEWDIHSTSDFNTALNCARNAMIAVSSNDVTGIYKDVKNPSSEYRRKKRTVIRGLTAISRHPEVLNVRRYGLFAFQVWSHKIMRWCVPWFMFVVAVLTLFLWSRHPFFQYAFFAQLIFYSMAMLGTISTNIRKFLPFTIVTFFVGTNIAIADATIAFMKGSRMTTWIPSQR